uniref:Uncharacterized protein n=1 Tax=Lotus japonicus TaxID=34305 RepID=I3SA70_LOTJA|nr:unknown [Lotus japonicus]
MTLLIGSAAGAFSSSATFPLEVARKHMQSWGTEWKTVQQHASCTHEYTRKGRGFRFV